MSQSLAQFFFFPYTKNHFSFHSTSIKPKFPSHPEYIHSTNFGFF
ncbi:MAG: hypothetical protein Q8M44_05810 [bacterium]|nr:hypothetical protein [bacterium]